MPDKENRSVTFRCDNGLIRECEAHLYKGTDPDLKNLSDVVRFGLELALGVLAQKTKNEQDIYRAAVYKKLRQVRADESLSRAIIEIKGKVVLNDSQLDLFDE